MTDEHQRLSENDIYYKQKIEKLSGIHLDIPSKLLYDKYMSERNITSKHLVATRGCTGFDGDFAVVEAIRGLGPR